MKIKMPIGQSDFRCLIQDHHYFVDKSLFIYEIIEDSASILLITRPRRFGKTLNLSMLRYYFAKEVNGQPTEELFKGLKIKQEKAIYQQHQGQYPVIYLTFKDMKQQSYEAAYEKIVQIMANVYDEFSTILLNSTKLTPFQKQKIHNILEGRVSAAEIEDSLRMLTQCLHDYYAKKICILIDEYDTPIQSGYLNGYYAEIVGLFRGFLGAALKDNPYCFKAVLTGILHVSKESLFSGLNNLAVYSVLDPEYGQYFGFTESEVQQLLQKADLAAHSQAIRHWYNGYQIGPHTIYNPWSILNCIKKGGRLIPYWLNTSDNALVKDCLYRSGLIHKEVFEELLQGQSIECLINERIVFPDLQTSFKNDSIILSFLLMAGYFKVVSTNDTIRGIQCQLAIPNLEVYGLYADLIENWLVAGQQHITVGEFLDALLRGDIAAFEESFRFLLENTISVHDLAQEPEAFYHGFMAGLTAHLQSHLDYELKSNRESGYGRYDYLILSRVPEKSTLLMEFKRVQFSEAKHPPLAQIKKKLEQAAKQALEQIKDKAYYTEAKARGSHKIIKLAIAFCGKQFKLMHYQ